MIRTIRVNGQECKGLIDTGCSKTILSPQIQVEREKIIAQKGTVLSFDGKGIPHEGEAEVPSKWPDKPSQSGPSGATES